MKRRARSVAHASACRPHPSPRPLPAEEEEIGRESREMLCMLQVAPFHHRTDTRKSNAIPALTRVRKLKRALQLPLSVLERGPGGEVSRKGRVRSVAHASACKPHPFPRPLSRRRGGNRQEESGNVVHASACTFSPPHGGSQIGRESRLDEGAQAEACATPPPLRVGEGAGG